MNFSNVDGRKSMVILMKLLLCGGLCALDTISLF